MVLDATDFQTIADSALKLFDQRLAILDPKIRGDFDMEVARLESQVVQLYGIAALLAQRENDLDKIAEIWSAMVSVCDSVATKMQTLCLENPFGIASQDKVLEIRSKSARLRDLHL